MKNWKDKVLGIFAGIGVMSLLMATNSQQPNVNYGTPESHVWEMYNVEGRAFAINKRNGEVRKYERIAGENSSEYFVMKPIP